MTGASGKPRRPGVMEIGACAICSTLGERETSFEKHGWPEQATRLPREAGDA